jgi:hypothetical protein
MIDDDDNDDDEHHLIHFHYHRNCQGHLAIQDEMETRCSKLNNCCIIGNQFQKHHCFNESVSVECILHIPASK